MISKTLKLIQISFFILGLNTVSPCQNSSNLFDGFKMLEVPRANIPIGALWTNVGPVGNGLPEESISIEDSYSSFETTIDKNLSAKINLGIQKALIGLGIKNVSESKISLNSVKIFRVTDIQFFKDNLGNEILFEGIKVDKVTFTVDKDKTAGLQGSLMDLRIGFQMDGEIGNKQKIAAEGLNLFIAYRVVRISQGKSKSDRIKFESETSIGKVSAKVGFRQFGKVGNYTITICPCDVVACVNSKIITNGTDKISSRSDDWIRECINSTSWNITVIDKSVLTNGQPKEMLIRSKMLFDIWNKNFSIAFKVKSAGIEVDYLSIEHLFFENYFLGDKFLAIKGSREKAYVIHETFSLENIIPSAQNGW